MGTEGGVHPTQVSNIDTSQCGRGWEDGRSIHKRLKNDLKTTRLDVNISHRINKYIIY